MLKNFFGFLTNKKGDTNTVGWIVLIIFIILAVAPNIQTIGQTMKTGATNLDTQLKSTLDDGE